MRTSLALTAVVVATSIIGTAVPAVAAPAVVEPHVDVHRVGPLMDYQLYRPANAEGWGQSDGGRIQVSYTCYRGDAPEGDGVNVLYGSSWTYGRADSLTLFCDDQRHVVTLDVGRGSNEPFTPPPLKVKLDRFTLYWAIGDTHITGKNSGRAWPILTLFRGW